MDKINKVDKYIEEYLTIITEDILKDKCKMTREKTRLIEILNKIYYEGHGDGYCDGYGEVKKQ